MDVDIWDGRWHPAWGNVNIWGRFGNVEGLSCQHQGRHVNMFSPWMSTSTGVGNLLS